MPCGEMAGLAAGLLAVYQSRLDDAGVYLINSIADLFSQRQKRKSRRLPTLFSPTRMLSRAGESQQALHYLTQKTAIS